jgi:hypothetical protein
MIPVEIISAVGGMVMGGVLELMAAKQDGQQKAMNNAISAAKQNNSAAESARKWDVKVPGLSFTKRVIAFAMTAAVTASVWAPILGAFNDFSISVVHGWMEFKPGFLFIPDKEVMVWHESISGAADAVYKIVITPAMSNTFVMIVGAYFGHSVSKRR